MLLTIVPILFHVSDSISIITFIIKGVLVWTSIVIATWVATVVSAILRLALAVIVIHAITIVGVVSICGTVKI